MAECRRCKPLCSRQGLRVILTVVVWQIEKSLPEEDDNLYKPPVVEITDVIETKSTSVSSDNRGCLCKRLR